MSYKKLATLPCTYKTCSKEYTFDLLLHPRDLACRELNPIARLIYLTTLREATGVLAHDIRILTLGSCACCVRLFYF
jgi:hypothetical protein